MISFIKGTIIESDKDNVVVQTNSGVGYEIYIPINKISSYRVGQEASFFTYLKVSDSALDLYGFENTEQKEFFELLMSVSGIGPKSAMNILNLGSIDEIKSAIARQDVKYLTEVQGLGQKTAGRLVVELKSKITGKIAGGNDGETRVLVDVVDGLSAMGYGKEEVKEVLNGLELKGKSTEAILRLVLKKLGK